MTIIKIKSQFTRPTHNFVQVEYTQIHTYKGRRKETGRNGKMEECVCERERREGLPRGVVDVLYAKHRSVLTHYAIVIIICINKIHTHIHEHCDRMTNLYTSGYLHLYVYKVSSNLGRKMYVQSVSDLNKFLLHRCRHNKYV